MYDNIWPHPEEHSGDFEWPQPNPADEIADMDYPVASTNPFAEVLHIELSIEAYFEVTADIRAAA
jgi:hypothetical protein